MLAFAGTANAAIKQFKLTIATASPTYNSSGLTGSGQTVTITATILNENPTQQLGSADLGVPSGLTVKAVSVPPPATAKNTTCNAVITGPCVQLRNLALAPGASTTVTMTVATSACASGPRNWTVEAKQANNFSGTPGNDLTPDPANSVTTTLDGACSLAYGAGPHSALTNQVISAVDWTPTAPPVTVQVKDANGNTLAASTASVAVALGKNPGAATLGGTTSAAADGSGGTATFSSLTLNKPANGYTVVASSGTLASATSDAFNIQDQLATCPAQGTCSTDSNSGKDHSSITATAVNNGGLLLESVNANNSAQLTCPGYRSADPNTYESLTTFDASKVLTTVIATPATHLSGNANQILKGQQICFGAPAVQGAQFITASGAPATAQTLPDGSPGFVGLLPTCTGSTTGPCHNRQQDTTIPDPQSPLGFDIVLVADVPAGFPGDPFHT